MPPRSLTSPEFYLNRSLSWLAFNRRVLEEAEDESNPLLERVKFLAITASNLDEFFEIRIAGLLQHLEEGQVDAGPDGLTPMDEQELVAEATHEFVREQYDCWNKKLLPALAEHGIRVHSLADLNDAQREVVDDYCRNELDALLTPVTVDPAHPFPRVIHKALCQALLLRRRRRGGRQRELHGSGDGAARAAAAGAAAGCEGRFLHCAGRPGRAARRTHVSRL